MPLLKHIINGCRDLPGYGPHPGTGITAFYILVCGLAGAQRGSWAGFFGGAAFGAAFFIPMYLIGAYDRGRLYERDKVQLMREIKDA